MTKWEIIWYKNMLGIDTFFGTTAMVDIVIHQRDTNLKREFMAVNYSIIFSSKIHFIFIN